MLIIPGNKLNGYNIVAQVRVQDNSSVYALLGYDPSRKYPKYVTAFATQQSVTDHPKCSSYYFEGHYFDTLPQALDDWIQRLRLPQPTKASTLRGADMDLETCSWCTDEVLDSTLRMVKGGDGARLCLQCQSKLVLASSVMIVFIR